jgi:IS4 transposase
MAWKPQRRSYRHEFIEAIATVFPPQWFSRFSSHGNAGWTPLKIFWVSTIMSWQPQVTLREQFDAACDILREVFPAWTIGDSLSGFLAARVRGLPRMRDPILLRLRQFVAEHLDDWRVRGWAVFGVDGSRFEAPRTTPNEQALGCAGKEGTTPQVFQTTLLHIGTGLPWDFRLGPGTQSERRQLDDMRDNLPPRSLLTADAGFISFELCRWLTRNRHDFVLRVGGNIRLLTGLDGPDLDWAVETEGQTVSLWPTRCRDQPPVVLRLIVVRDDQKRPVSLVTNIHDERALSDEDAAEIYRLRWGLELHYRSLKQTLCHQTLRSRTPEGALAEQTWHVLASWLLQLLTARELIASGSHPANWSAAKARDAVRRLLRRVVHRRPVRRMPSLRDQLCQAVVDRDGRVGPKQIRRWPRPKQDRPSGPPKIQPAPREDLQQLQRLRTTLQARS